MLCISTGIYVLFLNFPKLANQVFFSIQYRLEFVPDDTMCFYLLVKQFEYDFPDLHYLTIVSLCLFAVLLIETPITCYAVMQCISSAQLLEFF